ncbi:MAG: hypothetical protein QNJ51_31170 [Calothrix sp. MO_167.B12]|nr:hypothetical protein [Calothrix sp. MO_167.B12]
MFILKRQDVEISTIQHPKRDQQVPVLYYQGQTFRLINTFPASKEEEAVALWRDLTDNRGKACVLLEEPERYSIWGKVRLKQAEQADDDTGDISKRNILIQASLLLIQAVHMDIEDLLGSRHGKLFTQDISTILEKHQIIDSDSPEVLTELLNIDPLTTAQLPIWKEKQLVILLQELHRLGKKYFGNDNFANQVTEQLAEMADEERSVFIRWLKISPLSKLWQ